MWPDMFYHSEMHSCFHKIFISLSIQDLYSSALHYTYTTRIVPRLSSLPVESLLKKILPSSVFRASKVSI